ncbi:MAG: hypothetical protein EAX90_03540 [Candidatus Heimdallarchaeota archaeon]|nr:hypothetical protein [Candidatus Heimdallarchaeota archaeon]
MEKFAEIEKDLNWHNFNIAYDKLQKIEKGKLTDEEAIYVKLLHSKNIELFEPEQRWKFAEEAFIASKKLSNIDLILKSLIEIARCKQQLALFFESLEFIEQAEKLIQKQKENESMQKNKALILYYKGINRNRTGKLELAFETFREAELLAKKIDNKKLLTDIYLWIAINRGHVENYELGIKFALKAKEIAIEINHQVNETELDIIIGTYYFWTGKYSKAEQMLKEGMNIRKKIGKRYEDFIYRLGLNHFFKGELEEAIEYFNESKKHLDSKSINYVIRRNVPWSDGLVAWKKGKLNEAIKYMNQCIEESKKVGDEYHTNLNSIFLAAIYFDKGSINEALNLILESLDNLPTSSQNYTISLAQQLLGKIYQIKGEFNLALHHAQQSLKIQAKMETTHHLIETILLLISISVDKGELELANSYLEKLEKITEKTSSVYFKQVYIVAQALILKGKSRPKHWIKAIELLEEVVEGELTNHSLTVLAMINLCELLLNEFSISGDVEVLLELEVYTQTLNSIAKKQNVYSLKLEAHNIRLLTLWLKAQYSIVDLDIQKAKQLLTEARDMANEEGLILLAEKITQQQGNMFERMEKWDNFIRKYYEFIKTG